MPLVEHRPASQRGSLLRSGPSQMSGAGFAEWQRFFRRFGEESIQASQLPIEALDLFDCPWGWELQHGLRLVWAWFYPFRTDHVS
ncbi:hypothetical protein Tco_1007659 [Tanacetum coccineum]